MQVFCFFVFLKKHQNYVLTEASFLSTLLLVFFSTFQIRSFFPLGKCDSN